MFGLQLSLLRKLVKQKVPARSPRVGLRSDPALSAIWNDLLQKYFPERGDLKSYTVGWSNRSQKRVLASCSPRQRRVRVARELKYPQYQEWLEPLLYHELCHAVIGEQVVRHAGKRCWHGAEFKALEKRHPKTEQLNLWIGSGGWRAAVRSDRAKRAWAK